MKKKKINIIAKDEGILELDLSKFNPSQEINADLYYLDQHIGTLKNTQNHFSLNIECSGLILRVVGVIEIPMFTLNSASELIIENQFKIKQQIEIKATKITLQKKLFSTDVSLEASEELICKTSIDAVNVNLRAKNVFIEEDIYSTFLNVLAKNRLSNSKKLFGKIFNILEARIIKNEGIIHGERVSLEGIQSIENTGKISANLSLKFKTPELIDHGKICSEGKLKFYCHSVNATQSAEIISKTRFKFVGRQLETAG